MRRAEKKDERISGFCFFIFLSVFLYMYFRSFICDNWGERRQEGEEEEEEEEGECRGPIPILVA
jgi:hypothetical protein